MEPSSVCGKEVRSRPLLPFFSEFTLHCVAAVLCSAFTIDNAVENRLHSFISLHHRSPSPFCRQCRDTQLENDSEDLSTCGKEVRRASSWCLISRMQLYSVAISYRVVPSPVIMSRRRGSNRLVPSITTLRVLVGGDAGTLISRRCGFFDYAQEKGASSHSLVSHLPNPDVFCAIPYCVVAAFIIKLRRTGSTCLVALCTALQEDNGDDASPLASIFL